MNGSPADGNKRGMKLTGNECFSHSKTKTSSIRIFYCSYVGCTQFWPLPKLKKSPIQSSRIFIPEKGCFGTDIPNGSTENVEMMFFGYLAKTCSTPTLLFCCILFDASNVIRRRAQKNRCFCDGMNLFRCVYVGFLRNQTWQPQTLNENATSFYWVSKKSILTFQAEPFKKHDPNVLFPGWKTKRLHGTFFEFWQWPKLSATNVEAVENVKSLRFLSLDGKKAFISSTRHQTELSMWQFSIKIFFLILSKDWLLFQEERSTLLHPL